MVTLERSKGKKEGGEAHAAFAVKFFQRNRSAERRGGVLLLPICVEIEKGLVGQLLLFWTIEATFKGELRKEIRTAHTIVSALGRERTRRKGAGCYALISQTGSIFGGEGGGGRGFTCRCTHFTEGKEDGGKEGR